MNKYKYLIGLSIFGVLFSGYLSSAELFKGTCALTNGGCSDFLGYPTCYYGFAFFVVLFVYSFLYNSSKSEKHRNVINITSILAFIFSAYFSALEIIPMVTNGVVYDLFFPACAYGLVAYIIIFFLSRPKKDVVNDIAETKDPDSEDVEE